MPFGMQCAWKPSPTLRLQPLQISTLVELVEGQSPWHAHLYFSYVYTIYVNLYVCMHVCMYVGMYVLMECMYACVHV